MLCTKKKILAVVAFAGSLAAGIPLKAVLAAAQTSPAAAPAVTPVAPKVAAASPEALKLLRLMDADKNGKVSKAEYMAFMEAEFERLDVNHDGELDVKELEKSQLAVAHHGGTRR